MLSRFPVSSAPRRALAALASCGVLLATIGPALAVPLAGEAGIFAASPLQDHVVISELMTGGASASDEFVELYNPTPGPLSVEGLELVYVTASGGTITRKATWPAGAAPIPAGGHLLIANDAGIFSAISDGRYANGLAATGGSVALRVVGGSTAVDAVGWGTAASTWLETRPAPAPAAGSSLERLPCGTAGSGQDTNDNLLDFVVSATPDPQNSASPPISLATSTPAPSATPDSTPAITPEVTPTPSELPTDSPTPPATATPTPPATLSATPVPTPVPTPSSTPGPISIADARTLPDGATATVEGVALTDGAFTDGGGYLFDGTAGVAVLVSDGTFRRGELLRVTGVLDDRYSQRTMRATAADVVTISTGAESSPEVALTGSLGEALEGHLVQIVGSVTSSPSTLSTGIAFDLDDGSGSGRVVVGTGTGIDTTPWERGSQLTLVGVLGQRDSSGTGTAGYRLLPRDPLDILFVEPPATPTPTPTPSPTPPPTLSPTRTPVVSATPTPAPSADLVTIAVARSMSTGAHLRIRGVVTLPSGQLDGATAVVQDLTAGILIRLGDTAGTLALGQLVELDGIRSTKSGMLSLRVTTPALRLGTQADPDALRRATGTLSEAQEASLVLVRGAVATAILRSSAGTVSFSLDDGSGPIRITIAPKSGISLVGVTRGAWLELRGVLGQETTGREADKGYRIWPRRKADVTLFAAVATASSPKPSTHAVSSGQLPAISGAEGSAAPGLPGNPGTVPLLALAMPTPSPDAAAITGSAAPHGADGHRPQPAALLGVSLGMALLAGAMGLRSRRRTGTDQANESDQPLSLVPIEVADAREERRILPPT